LRLVLSVGFWLLPVLIAHGETVAPGVTFRQLQFMRGADGPFAMQVLEVDPRNAAVNLLPVRARDAGMGRETTSSMAQRLGAAAAVNGE